MDINKIPIFELLGQKLAWLSQRQRVLAENVANADTPGYQARDLEKPDFAALLRHSAGGADGLRVSNPGHIGGPGGGSLRGRVASGDAGATPTGNSVDLPMEMMKMGETQMEYTTISSLYKKHIKLIKIAIGRER